MYLTAKSSGCYDPLDEEERAKEILGVQQAVLQSGLSNMTRRGVQGQAELCQGLLVSCEVVQGQEEDEDPGRSIKVYVVEDDGAESSRS